MPTHQDLPQNTSQAEETVESELLDTPAQAKNKLYRKAAILVGATAGLLVAGGFVFFKKNPEELEQIEAVPETEPFPEDA